MKYRHILQVAFVLLLISLQASCSRLNNEISRVILECGSDSSPTQEYIQILDIKGNSMEGSDLSAQRIDSDGTIADLPVTSRGCVATKDLGNDLLLVRSTAPGRSWGFVSRGDGLPLLRRKALKDISNLEPKVENCESLQYTQGPVELSIRWPDDGADAFPAEARIKQSGFELSTRTLGIQGSVLDLSAGAKDGEIELEIAFRNLFRDPSDPRFETRVKCPFRLDRAAPVMKSSLAKTLKPGLFKVAPGEKITLEVNDAHPKSIHSCLSEEQKPSTCQDMKTFDVKLGSETSHLAPGQGKWCLQYFAEDAAGNQSALQSDCFVAYQESVISEIKETLTSYRVLYDDNRLAAVIRLIKALKDFVSLPTAEERSAIQALAFETIAGSQNEKEREKNRWMLEPDEDALAVVGKEGLFVTLGRKGLRLWDSSGVLRDSFEWPKQRSVTTVSVRGNDILLIGDANVAVFSVSDAKLQLRSDFSEPRLAKTIVAKWNPSADEFLLVYKFSSGSQIQPTRNVIYSWQNGSYKAQNLSDNTSAVDGAEWSASGNLIVFAKSPGRPVPAGDPKANSIEVLARQSDGGFMPIPEAVRYGKFKGSIFLENAGVETLLLHGDDNTLQSWTAAGGFSEPVPIQKRPTTSPIRSHKAPVFLRKDAGLTFLLHDMGIYLVSFAGDGKLEIKQILTPSILKSTDVSKWDWQDELKRLTLLGEEEDGAAGTKTHIARFNLYKEGQSWGLVSSGILSSGRDLFKNFGVIKALTVTLTAGSVSVWGEETPKSIFSVIPLVNDVFSWVPAAWAERGSFLIASRNTAEVSPELLQNWDERQQRPKCFTDETEVELQSFAWGKDVFTSIYDDGTFCIWDRSLKLVSQLKSPTIPNPFQGGRALYRAIFSADDTAMASYGNGRFNLWKRDGEGSSFALERHFFEDFVDPDSQDADMGRSYLSSLTWQGQSWIIAMRSNQEGVTELGLFDWNGNPAPIKRLSFPNGTEVLVNKNGARIFSWNYARGKSIVIHTLTDQGYISTLNPLEMPSDLLVSHVYPNPVDETVAVILNDGSAQIWGLNEQGEFGLLKQDKIMDKDKRVFPSFITWWSNPQQLAYSVGGSIRVIDKEFKLVRSYNLQAGSEFISSLEFSPDRRYARIELSGRKLRILDTDEDAGRVLKGICADLENFMQNSNEFDRSLTLSPEDRSLCQTAVEMRP